MIKHKTMIEILENVTIRRLFCLHINNPNCEHSFLCEKDRALLLCNNMQNNFYKSKVVLINMKNSYKSHPSKISSLIANR